MLILHGCQQESYSIQPKQDLAQITAISFVDNTCADGAAPHQERLVLQTVEEIDGFIRNLQNVVCRKVHNDPPTSYGYLYIKIQYSNGDAEFLGTDSLVYECANGEIQKNANGWLYVDMDSMIALFFQYTGQKPEIPYR